MAINFEDSADLEYSLQFHVLTKGFDIATIHKGRISDARYTTAEHTATPCTVLYLYSTIKQDCPINDLLDCHPF